MFALRYECIKIVQIKCKVMTDRRRDDKIRVLQLLLIQQLHGNTHDLVYRLPGSANVVGSAKAACGVDGDHCVVSPFPRYVNRNIGEDPSIDQSHGIPFDGIEQERSGCACTDRL